MSDSFDTEIWDRDYPTAEEEYQAAVDMYEEDDSDMYEDEEYDEEFYEDFIEEYTEDDELSIVDEAHVRLDQGRLYKMLIGHNLFEGVDADPTAIANVQKELKDFILERLEILLGMRAEKEKSEATHVTVQSDFNELEVQALKMIASKVTRGRSEVEQETEPQPSELNTVKAKPKKQGLNALGSPQKKKAAPVKKTKPKVKPKSQGKPLRKSAQERPKRKIKKEMADVSTKNLSATDVAKRDINYIESIKNKSLEEANEIVAQRHKKPVPKTTIDQNVVNSHYQTKVATSEGTLSDFGRIMRLAALNKANGK
jgi:hypothetical protein